MMRSKEFILPAQLSTLAAQDELTREATVLRILRTEALKKNPLADANTPYFVLSFDLWDNTFAVTGSFGQAAEALAEARRKNMEEDDFVSFYPFDFKGTIIDDEDIN